MSFFVIRHGNFELGWIELSSAFSIGRHPQSDLSLNDALLSRNHFQFEFADNQWFASDLGSKNGTWIDGRKIDREPLADKDLILAGRYSFEFRVGTPEGKKYAPTRPPRPADPHEALQGTLNGVAFHEFSPENAAVSKRRPRPIPKPSPSVGLLENPPPQPSKPRFPILLELPSEDDLSPTAQTLHRPPSPIPESPRADLPPRPRLKFNLDFVAFLLILALLAAGFYAIGAFIPHW